MNSVLVTMAPAMEAHQHVLPGAHGGERDDQFGQVPSVALSRPPTASPVLAATDSVA